VGVVRTPSTAEELADELRRSALHERTIVLEGAGSKRAMGGPAEGDDTISLAGLHSVLEYEPRDLTVSVEAGMPWCELTGLLAGHRQMVPLDPPFADRATVGGVIAANSSGPRRRLYGTARDMVIGMRFAMVDGKVVETGGMVVKNVAGLDMAKLMIGSLGTLAAIASVNFKVQPVPEIERTFVLPFPTAAEALAARGAILTSALQPGAVDLLNPTAGTTVGNPAWLLAVRAAGNAASVERYERELARGGQTVAFEGEGQSRLWRHIEDFTPAWLEGRPDGAVVRASCTLKEVEAVMESFPGPAIARAGSGVCHGYFASADEALAWLAKTPAIPGVVEFAPAEWKRTAELWPRPGGDLEIMRRVKKLFDPGNVLNRGRLYGRI
jgi:glycolate oxidase FAD binding subunit